MRRLLTFPCEGATLGGSLDEGAGPIGLLLVTGGSQTRIGSHRMYERLARSLAEAGHAVLRFDRRGVGDSEGADPGFRRSAPDLAAAAAAFRRECPGLERLIGFGLCDGATTLALHGAVAGLDGAILVNPWLVEAEADAPPPAAIKHHYRQRLASLDGWKKLLDGSVSYRKLFRGVAKILFPSPSGLSGEVVAALGRKPLPLALILAQGDATAIAAEAEWRSAPFRKVRAMAGAPLPIESDSHTFARPGDAEALLAACLDAVARLSRG